jgi:hypothetical protein
MQLRVSKALAPLLSTMTILIGSAQAQNYCEPSGTVNVQNNTGRELLAVTVVHRIGRDAGRGEILSWPTVRNNETTTNGDINWAASWNRSDLSGRTYDRWAVYLAYEVSAGATREKRVFSLSPRNAGQETLENARSALLDQVRTGSTDYLKTLIPNPFIVSLPEAALKFLTAVALGDPKSPSIKGFEHRDLYCEDEGKTTTIIIGQKGRFLDAQRKTTIQNMITIKTPSNTKTDIPFRPTRIKLEDVEKAAEKLLEERKEEAKAQQNPGQGQGQGRQGQGQGKEQEKKK